MTELDLFIANLKLVTNPFAKYIQSNSIIFSSIKSLFLVLRFIFIVDKRIIGE